MLEYGVSVVSIHDGDETAHLLAMMARHAHLGVPEISLVPKRLRQRRGVTDTGV